MNPHAPLSKSPNGRHGFSLIELLVTIGVVALLIALITPAISAGKNTAERTTCVLRLHHSNHASTLYENDHDGEVGRFNFPLDGAGRAEPMLAPEWGVGGGGWLVSVFAERTFWGYHIRSYAGDGSVLEIVESMTCPTVFDLWNRSRPNAGAGEVLDPMAPLQRSFNQSLALTTSARAWVAGSAPLLEEHHAPVRAHSVRHPALKIRLIEPNAHHEPVPVSIEQAGGTRGSIRFNALLSDGSARGIRPSDAEAPAGFRTFGTGLEIVPVIDPNAWAERGIPFISTARGYLGRDLKPGA